MLTRIRTDRLSRTAAMSHPILTRRAFCLAAGAAAATALIRGPFAPLPARAATGLAPTQSMRGGANNYRPGAPLVDNLGSGFTMSGTVRRAGDGAPLQGVRIQIWAATTRGGEREPSNHGSVLTDAQGRYALEMEQIVPNFGQPHAHLAYDDGAYETVFLRPVMPSASDTSLQAHFVLGPA
jgi:protocatechuate 3,4-dioxygenase beta subunit